MTSHHTPYSTPSVCNVQLLKGIQNQVIDYETYYQPCTSNFSDIYPKSVWSTREFYGINSDNNYACAYGNIIIGSTQKYSVHSGPLGYQEMCNCIIGEDKQYGLLTSKDCLEFSQGDKYLTQTQSSPTQNSEHNPYYIPLISLGSFSIGLIMCITLAFIILCCAIHKKLPQTTTSHQTTV